MIGPHPAMANVKVKTKVESHGTLDNLEGRLTRQ
jgi:hypothetical protein